MKVFTAIWVAFFYGVVFLIPIIAGIGKISSFHREIFSDPLIWSTLRFTIFQASLSALLASVIGFALFAYSFERFQIKLKPLVLFPFVMPTLLIVETAVCWFGRNWVFGQWNFLYRWEIVVAIHAWVNAPWFFMQLHEAQLQISKEEFDAAQVFGATRMKRFSKIVLPQIWSVISESSAAIFSFCVMSYTVVTLLGGGPPVETLETKILQSVRGGGGDLHFDVALVCALFQAVITLSVWGGCRFLSRVRRKAPVRRVREIRRAEDDKNSIGFVMGFLLIWVFPIVFLYVNTLNNLKSDFGLFINAELIQEFFQSFFQSVSIATMVTTAALCLVVSSLYWVHQLSQRGVNSLVLFLLPSGFSSLTLSVLAWSYWAPMFSPLDHGIWYLLCFQTLLLAPLGIRMLNAVILSSDSTLFDAALACGAGPLRAFWVAEVPRLIPVTIQYSAISFCFSLGELALLHLFRPDHWSPLPALIATFNSRYQFQEASWVACTLGLTVLAVLGFTEFFVHKYKHLT